MILTDAINLVLAEYPGMKAIGAAESADACHRTRFRVFNR